MRKLIAVALLAVPLTFAQSSTGSTPTDNSGDAAKTKKHGRKHSKKAKADDATTAPATK